MTRKERIDLLKDIISIAIDHASNDTGIYFTVAEEQQALKELATE